MALTFLFTIFSCRFDGTKSHFNPAENSSFPFTRVADRDEKPDPDPTLKKNQIRIRPSRKTGSISDPQEKPDSEPTLTKNRARIHNLIRRK